VEPTAATERRLRRASFIATAIAYTRLGGGSTIVDGAKRGRTTLAQSNKASGSSR
jgi:hypothetical protein